MKLLLYGGTFDPPHTGHMNLLRAAVKTVQPDKVIVMPAGTPPHKKASTTPGCLRLAMCSCFARVDSSVEISDWEIARREKSYTIDTVRMLLRQFPGAQIYLCIGSDMLETFESWREWQQLANSCILVAHCRQTTEKHAFVQKAERLRQKGVRIVMVDADIVVQASSTLRGQLENGEISYDVLPDETARVARRYCLYQPKGEK